MNSEIFAKLPPTKLFFHCAVPAVIMSLFGTLIFPIAFLFILTAIWDLNGVWLMASVAATASGILTLSLAKTLKIDSQTENRSA